MTAKSIIIAEPAYLIRYAIISLVRKITKSARIFETADLETSIQTFNRFDIDLLIINTNIGPDLSKNIINLKSKYRKLKVIGINNLDSANNTLEQQLDETINLEDDKNIILKKLKQILSLPNDHSETTTSELSQRELTILKMVAAGMTNQNIADKLFISLYTVITHRKNITKKLDIKTVAGLTVYAILNDLIKPGEIR